MEGWSLVVGACRSWRGRRTGLPGGRPPAVGGKSKRSGKAGKPATLIPWAVRKAQAVDVLARRVRQRRKESP